MNEDEVLVNQQQTTNDNETRQSNAIWEALHKRFADAANNLFSLIKKTDKKVEEKGEQVREQVPAKLVYNNTNSKTRQTNIGLPSRLTVHPEKLGGKL